MCGLGLLKRVCTTQAVQYHFNAKKCWTQKIVYYINCAFDVWLYKYKKYWYYIYWDKNWDGIDQGIVNQVNLIKKRMLNKEKRKEIVMIDFFFIILSERKIASLLHHTNSLVEIGPQHTLI